MILKKVLIVDLITGYPSIEKNILGDNVEVIVGNATDISDVPDNLWSDCNGFIFYNNLIADKVLINKMENCEIISRAGIGYDNIDLDAAKDCDIKVCNVPEYCVEEVSNHTIAMMLNFSTGVLSSSNGVIDGKWERTDDLCFRLKGKTLGIIGLGRIGSKVAKKSLSLGLDVVYYDPYVNFSKNDYLKVDSLEELAKRSDIISIHAPLTDETNKMVDKMFFAHCKNVCLLNTARGDIIDIDDLYDAMKKELILYCGLDVLNIEPPDGSQRLVSEYLNKSKWLSKRLIVTPHSSFYSPASFDELRARSAVNIREVFDGRDPKTLLV